MSVTSPSATVLATTRIAAISFLSIFLIAILLFSSHTHDADGINEFVRFRALSTFTFANSSERVVSIFHPAPPEAALRMLPHVLSTLPYRECEIRRRRVETRRQRIARNVSCSVASPPHCC